MLTHWEWGTQCQQEKKISHENITTFHLQQFSSNKGSLNGINLVQDKCTFIEVVLRQSSKPKDGVLILDQLLHSNFSTKLLKLFF